VAPNSPPRWIIFLCLSCTPVSPIAFRLVRRRNHRASAFFFESQQTFTLLSTASGRRSLVVSVRATVPPRSSHPSFLRRRPQIREEICPLRPPAPPPSMRATRPETTRQLIRLENLIRSFPPLPPTFLSPILSSHEVRVSSSPLMTPLLRLLAHLYPLISC